MTDESQWTREAYEASVSSRCWWFTPYDDGWAGSNLARDDELRGITNSYMSRYNDYRVFTDPETQQLIDELQIKLIGWKEIKNSVDF